MKAGAAAKAATVRLRTGKAKPFWYRHPWVFAGAVQRIDGDPADGDVVDVRDESGRFVASGFFNAESQIRVRLVSFREGEEVGPALVKERVREALVLRRDLLGLPSAETDAYRLVHSEGDGLPGIVADVYGGVVVVQYASAGMRRLADAVDEALEDLLAPRAVYERVTGFAVEKEKLFGASGVRRGALDDPVVPYRQNGVAFLADVARGQKTGAYLDQRENHFRLAGLSRGRRVLDAHTHAGGFALTAAVRGEAGSVLAVDSSESAVRLAREGARRNGVEDRVTVVESDAADVLSDVAARDDTYDVVCVDPPKFAKSRSEREGAIRGYAELFRVAMGAVRPGGVLLACSCAYHVSAEDLLFALNSAGRDADRAVQVLSINGQSADHPIRTPLVEGLYLKAITCRIP